MANNSQLSREERLEETNLVLAEAERNIRTAACRKISREKEKGRCKMLKLEPIKQDLPSLKAKLTEVGESL